MKNVIKVLIVDDDKASANSLAEIVKRAGFKPVVATKAADALNLVRLQTVHAAVVDVLLPKMTGVELVEEFRKTKFGDGPVIFVSGVFKDKAFGAEAIKKTGAKDFLFKPLEVDVFLSSLTEMLQQVVNAEKWTVQTLLSRQLKSSRERSKAIEGLEQVEGQDFPFVLSILMNAGASGTLNIVSDSGEIFGVSLVKGTIAEMDSNDAQSSGVLALISSGYLSQEDWEVFEKANGAKVTLEKLVESGFVSPHAVTGAHQSQILNDFGSICTANSLQINFAAQDSAEEPPKHAATIAELIAFMENGGQRLASREYLTSFYRSVLDSPLKQIGEESRFESIWASPRFANMASLKSAIVENRTVASAIVADPKLEGEILHCVHFLVLNQAIMFDDVNRAKNINAMLERYRKLFAELQNKAADKIFEYFGAAPNASPAIIQGIFDEYAKANDPDQLGKEATPELKKICKSCFDMVNEARRVMVDPELRAKLHEEMKSKQVERVNQSQKLMNEGLDALRRGQAKEALEKLLAAEKLNNNPLLSYISAWAEAKVIGATNKPRLTELVRKLELTPAEDRRSAYHHMAMGMLRKRLGDLPAATASFQKAVDADSQFVEARRELRAMQNPEGSTAVKKKSDLFTGDITEIVSNIFRRKAE